MNEKKLNQKYFEAIRKQFSRKFNFEGKYDAHKDAAKYIRMSRGATQTSLYGLYPPHAEINLLTDTSKLGEVVVDGKYIDFKYFFDGKDRVTMIDRYDPTSQYYDKRVGTIFVEHEKHREINVLICKGRTESITTVAKCKLDLYGRLIRYVECTCGVDEYPYVYTVMRLKHNGGKVKITHSVYSVWQQGDEVKTSERKYVYKRGKLYEIT